MVATSLKKEMLHSLTGALERILRSPQSAAGSRRIVGLLISGSLICLWLLVGLWAWREYHNTLESNAQVLNQLNIVVQEQTQGLFKQAETSLVVARNWIQNHPQDDPGTHTQFITLVDELRKTSNGLLDLRMVTRSGVLRYIPDRGQASQTVVTDRDYFRAQADPTTRGFFVGKAVKSRVTGKWGIPISIPVERAGGDIGVLFVAIELDRIFATFEGARLKPNGTIAIYRTDGVSMLRSPFDEVTIGKSIADSSSWQEHLSLGPRGSYISQQGPLDGRPRQVAYSRLGEYPLLVAVTADMDDLLAPWRMHVLFLTLVALGISLGFGLLSAILLRAMDAEATMRADLQRLMLTDPLTGIGNRRHLTQRLAEEVARAHRYQRPLTVAFFDIDHFKRINDTLGHSVGDRVLKRVADNLSSALRVSDHLGRFGGEEFVLVLPETTLENALPLIERMRESIPQFPELDRPLTMSAGAAQIRPREDAESLLQRSDAALYQAKGTGRNRTCIDATEPPAAAMA